jgi:hypothetical protein
MIFGAEAETVSFSAGAGCLFSAGIQQEITSGVAAGFDSRIRWQSPETHGAYFQMKKPMRPDDC